MRSAFRPMDRVARSTLEFRKLHEIPPNPIRDAVDHDQAATCIILCRQWLRDHPDDLWVTHEYAGMLYKMSLYEEALDVYRDAIERFPEFRWGFHNQIGHLHRYRGDLPAAEAAYKQAIDDNPDEAASYIFLGAVQARQGKLIEAERTHRQATRCTDGCVDEAYHNLGLVLRGQWRLADAKACFEKALEIDSDYAEAIEALKDVTTAIQLQS